MAQDQFKLKPTNILNTNNSGSNSFMIEDKPDSPPTSGLNNRENIFGDMPLGVCLGLVLLFLLLINCASPGEVRLLQSSEKDLVKAQKQSIFLFRILVEIDGKPINMFKEINEKRIQISIANIDREAPVERITKVYSPSVEMGKKGWFYLVLEPAAYYLKISSIWHIGFNPVLFYIPTGTSLVYGGSISFYCSGGLASNFGCSNIQLSNETVSADAIAAQFFQEFSPVAPFISEIITDALPESIKNDITPIGILASANSKLELPSWRESIWNRATGVPDWWTDDKNVPSAMKNYLYGWGAAGYGAPGALAGYIVYLSLALPYAAVRGEASQYYWTSCMQKNMDDLSKSELQKEIFSAIRQEIPSLSNESHDKENLNNQNPKQIKSFLEVNIAYIGLKECQTRGTFCPEVSFCVKLWDVASKKVVYNKIFVYTNYSRRAGPVKPYFSLISGAGCREMSLYCAEDTRSVFRQEVSQSIEAVAKTIKKEIVPSDK